MGNDNARRHLAIVAHMTENPTPFQPQYGVDAVNPNGAPYILRSPVSEEISQSCIIYPLLQSKPLFSSEHVVHFRGLPGCVIIVISWLPSTGSRNRL